MSRVSDQYHEACRYLAGGVSVAPTLVPEPERVDEVTDSGMNWVAEPSTVKVSTAKLDALVDMVGELVIAQAILAEDPALNATGEERLNRRLAQVKRITSDIQRDSGPMIKDAREAIGNLNRASKVVGGEEEQARLKKTIDEVAQLATRANATAADAQSIVSHIKKGNGTVGALVMDEAIYDDVQEMVRDLKHNPWKFLWRE